MTALTTAKPLTSARADFPALHQTVHGKPLVYLDNAATAQKPNRVIEATRSFYEEDNANVHRGVHTLSQRATTRFEATREKVRRLLNAQEPAEVIFTKGCTEGINLVSQSFARPRLSPGDQILLSTMEHHSNIVPWQIVAEQTGAEVLPIPISDSGEVLMEEYATLLQSGRVRMVGVVHVSNALGTVNPVREMVRMAHEVGAFVLVDGAQAGPHLPVDVQDLDADFYTLSCHKIYAPTGVGILYGKRAHLDAMPPYHGGGDMIRTVRFSGTTYAPLPAKFEAGTPNIAGFIGFGAALDYLEGFGEPDAPNRLHSALAKIAAWEHELTAYGMSRLAELPGVKLIGTAPGKAGILSFVMQAAHPHDIGTILDQEGVAIRAGHHCTMPLMERLGVPATARASLALYNTHEDLDRLVEALARVNQLFG